MIFLVLKNTSIKLHLHTIIHLKLVASLKTLNSRQHPLPLRWNCNRKITWFNPPYTVTVKTNTGRIFLQLIDKHFPRHHKYHKLLKKNNIKISYNCMSEKVSVIRSHNTSFLKNSVPTDIKECSCHRKPECPLNKKYLSECLVYNASVDRLDTSETKH